MRWDVVVVGAGPAGCAAAAGVLQARPDAAVLILDRADFPRDKACGDGIAAEVFDVLGELGFDVDAILAGYPPIPRLRLTSPGGATADRPMHRAVRVIPRAVFDDRLLRDVVARGAVFHRHNVKVVSETAQTAIVDDRYEADIVVAADGAESTVRRSLGLPATPTGHVALAIRGYAEEPAGQSGTQVITMTRRAWPAYAWSFPIGDGRVNVGYGELLGRRPVTRERMLEQLHTLIPGITDAPAHLRAHRLPLSSGRQRIRDGRVLLVGDSRSLINPLTGEGIYYAVVSGSLAGAVSAVGAGAGAAYRAASADRFGRHFRHTSTLSRLSRWPGLMDAGVRAARADQTSFDDLVRMGLADGLVTGRVVRHLRLR